MKAVLVIVLASGVASADERTPITLAEAVAAVAKAPAAAVPIAQVVAAEASVDAAGAWPSSSLRVGTNRLTARLTAAASLPLPVFGTLGAARRHAVAEAVVTRAQADVAQRALRHHVVHAWVELARADGNIVATSIAAQQAAELELIARGRKDAGVGADVDVTVAGAARARAELDVATAQRMEDAASAELAGLLGWDPDRPLRASGSLVTDGPPALGTLRAHLLAHPERVLARDRVAAANANVRQVLAERWPAIALDVEVMYDDRTMTEGTTARDRTDAAIGIAFDLPLFAHAGDRARVARALEAEQRASLAAIESELGASLYASYRRWQGASERLLAIEREVVPAQERAAALSARAYREGARDLASALQAERDLAAVRAEVNGARADAATALADLQLAAGDEVGRAR